LQALDDLRKHQYDLVVLDDSMPDLSALELHLNLHDLARNSPRILVATAAPAGARHARIRDGLDAHVAPPDEVLDCLLPLLQRVRAGN
jgi:CheY-like chemotaxis protein